MLPSNSPELDGYVEQANLAHTEELYEVTDSSFNIPQLTAKLLNWEQLCNAFCPHQSSSYLTLQEYLQCYLENWKKEGDV